MNDTAKNPTNKGARSAFSRSENSEKNQAFKGARSAFSRSENSEKNQAFKGARSAFSRSENSEKNPPNKGARSAFSRSENSEDIKLQMERLSILKEKLSATTPSENDGKTKVFISVGYKEERAVVFTGVGNHFDTAYKSAQDKAIKHIKSKNAPPPWLKADLVTNEIQLKMDELIDLASKIKKYFFHYGISLDTYYNVAFLPQEINGACLIQYDPNGNYEWVKNEKIDNLVGNSKDPKPTGIKATLNANNINPYLKNSRGQRHDINPRKITDVTVFETTAYFCDEKNEYYEMDKLPLCRDRRKVDELTPSMIIDLLQKSSTYLTTTVLESGRFVYGYFSCYDRMVPSYNSVRHALGVYSLAESYLVTKDEALLTPLKKSMDYMISDLTYEVDNCCFLVDFENKNEIKLGALAVAILAITRSLEIFDEKEHYLPVLRKLGNGIMYMQNPATGKFVHVLRYPSLRLVDEFRIVYYSGEAAFALMRLYGVDKDEKWLNAVKKAFEFFIANDYWKYYDHWLAYCTNELTAVAPDDRYFKFGLKNTFYRLDFIIDRLTTWPTFLEMLTASYTMIRNIKRAGKEHLLEGYDVDKFMYSLKVRAERQLNGIFFPEMAMYFKSPQTIYYGVFIRHHSFRVRNDDVAHHLSGYCHYLTDVLLDKGDEVAVSPQKMTADADGADILGKIKIMFLLDNIRGRRNGIITSVIRKAKMIEDYWNYKPLLVTKEYNLDLRKNIKKLVNDGILNKDPEILNMYEYFQGADSERKKIDHKKDEVNFSYRPISIGVYNVYDNEALVRKEIWNTPERGLRKVISYRENGTVEYTLFYDDFGYLSKKQLFNEGDENNAVSEQFFSVDGSLKIIINYHMQNDNNTVKEIYLSNSPEAQPDEGAAEPSGGMTLFKSEYDLFAYYVNEILDDDRLIYFLISEPIRLSGVPLSVKKSNVVKAAVVHNTFLKDPNDINSEPNNIFSLLCKRLNEFDGVVTLTDESKNDLKIVAGRYNDISRTSLHVIPHAYHLPFEKPDFEKRDLKKAVIVSRFDLQKRLDLAVRIFGKVIEKVPDAVLEIYGFGSEDEKNKMQQAIKEVRGENNIFLKGFTDKPHEIYRTAALSMCTSSFESFMLSMMESLSNGCPVVGYDVKYGPSLQIDNGYNGYLFPFGDIDDFADKVAELLGDKNELQRLGDNAFTKASTEFNAEKYTDSWRLFVEDCMKNAFKL